MKCASREIDLFYRSCFEMIRVFTVNMRQDVLFSLLLKRADLNVKAITVYLKLPTFSFYSDFTLVYTALNCIRIIFSESLYLSLFLNSLNRAAVFLH